MNSKAAVAPKMKTVSKNTNPGEQILSDALFACFARKGYFSRAPSWCREMFLITAAAA
jgi:hypothetical protein